MVDGAIMNDIRQRKQVTLIKIILLNEEPFWKLDGCAQIYDGMFPATESTLSQQRITFAPAGRLRLEHLLSFSQGSICKRLG
jgi:hypothetical protein